MVKDMENKETKKLYNPETIRSLPRDIQMNHGDLVELMESKLRHLQIDGRLVMQDEYGEFIGYKLMEEDYFVEHWLAQFALGRIDGTCYFDLDGWYDLTDGYTNGIIVLNSEEKNYLFIIDSFITINFGSNELKNAFQSLGNRASKIASPMIPIEEKAKHINDFAVALEINDNKAPKEENEDKFTSLIPNWFYAKHNVNPNVMKSLIYIRTNYKYKGNSIDPDSDIFSKIESIMTKYYTGENLSTLEKELITEVTNGELILENYTPNKVEVQAKKIIIEDEPFDPLLD